MLPIAGLSDQVTAVFLAPVTEAVKCWVCAANRVTLAGATDTATATDCKVTAAEASVCAKREVPNIAASAAQMLIFTRLRRFRLRLHMTFLPTRCFRPWDRQLRTKSFDPEPAAAARRWYLSH